jgi:hypothetical protein
MSYILFVLHITLYLRIVRHIHQFVVVDAYIGAVQRMEDSMFRVMMSYASNRSAEIQIEKIGTLESFRRHDAEIAAFVCGYDARCRVAPELVA